MTDRLKFALMGCGRIAQRHAAILAEADFSRLVGVCDILPERAQALGAKHSVPWFSSIDELLASTEVDVVCVLTPSGLHADHVIAIAPRVRSIVVEKPMALALDDADRMIRACDEARSRLFVVKQNRYNLAVTKLREALEQGRFGRLVLGTVRVRWCRHQSYYDQDSWRGTWALDGGVLANQASHHVDLLEWMLGDVESVMAKAATQLAHIEAEDTAVAVLKFRNGALGVIEATTATRPTDLEGSLSVLGEGGTVEIGGFAVNEMRTWKFVEPRPEDEQAVTTYRQSPRDVYGFGHISYLRDVASCIRDNRKALVDGIEGRKSLELITGLYESIETGNEVQLRFRPQRCKLGVRDAR